MGTLRIAPKEFMKLTIYDKDENEIVDKAEAVPVVDELPEVVKEGEVLLLSTDGHYYIGVKNI